MFDKKQLEKQPHSWCSHLNTTTRFLLSLPVKQLPKRAKRWTHLRHASYWASYWIDPLTAGDFHKSQTFSLLLFYWVGESADCTPGWVQDGWWGGLIGVVIKIRILNIFIISNPIHIYILTFPLNDILIDSGGIHISCAILRLDYAVLGPLWEI